MNEQVLKAIIQLLAISVSIDGVTQEERESIKRFLLEQVDDRAAERYVQLFDVYAHTAVHDTQEILRICHQINAELELKQKIIIVLRLIELGLADNNFSSAEEDFMKTVLKVLHIQESIYVAIRTFVETRDIYSVTSENILLIDAHPPIEGFPSNYIFRPKVKSTLGVLRLPEVDMYLVGAAHPAEDVYLNGRLMKSHHVRPLTSGSVIRASGETIYYSDIIGSFLQTQKRPRITFEAKGISYFFPSGKQALHDIHIAEESGTLVAIMGASGSGKSTLLNVLNGHLKPQVGQVLLNEIDIYRQEEKVQGIIGYVPQTDLLMEELTVYENLYYAARLCFAHLSDFSIDRLVIQTMQSLGIYEIKDLKVGSVLEKTISGGQRKRVNIGLELLRQPAIMFVDEPTSGLSSRDSEKILDLLRELTMLGKLIFVVIHQPSSDLFKMFDKLVILDIGGYQVYYGNPVEAIVYFKDLVNQIDRNLSGCIECGNINAEEIFEIIESPVVDEYGRSTHERKVSPQQWFGYFKEHIRLPFLTTTTEKPVSSLQIPSRFEQFEIFVTRDLLSKLGNRAYMIINLVQAPILAFILAYIIRFYVVDELTESSRYSFADNVNIPAFIFMSIIVSLFMGLTISAEEIIKDAKNLKREAFLHLSRNSYLLSKMAILFSFSAIQTLSYVLLGNWIVGVKGLNLLYWAVMFSCSCFANMLGLIISDSFKSVITIYILIPVLLIPQLILGGVVIKFDEMNPKVARQGEVPLVGDLMVSRWAFEALVVGQFMYNDYEKEFYPYEKQMAIADYKKTYYLPTLQSKLEYCSNQEGEEEKLYNDTYTKNLDLLRREVGKEMQRNTEIKFNAFNKLKTGYFDRATAEQLKKYLEQSILFYTKVYNKAFDRRDSIMGQHVKTEQDQQAFLYKREDYQNEAIARLATNTTVENRIIEHRGQLLQRIYPIYHDAPDLGSLLDFRTHFFAPGKPFLGKCFPTVVCNIVIIWLMSLTLYIALYFRLLRRLISGRAFQFRE